MSTRFDGSAVLSAIAGHPAVFPALKSEIDATARKMLLKQLKAATLNLDLIARILAAVGESSVRIGLDEMSAKDLSGVARRLDPANSHLSSMNEVQLGDHLCALARGDAKPLPGKKVTTPRTPAKRPKKELSKIGEILNSRVHSGESLEPATTKAAGGKKGTGRKA